MSFEVLKFKNALVSDQILSTKYVPTHSVEIAGFSVILILREINVVDRI